VLAGSYGPLRHAAVAADGALWVLTGNREGRGDPAADDDRVLRFPGRERPAASPPGYTAGRRARTAVSAAAPLGEGSMADVLAAILLALILLLFAGIVIAFLVVAGWFLYAVVAVARGRRPRTGYGRQLLAAERGRGRRPRRRGRNFPGITIFLDARGPEAPKREP
jgi:hypothetical protein